MINANRLVRITKRIISGGSSDLETNGLALTKSDRIPADVPAMSFGSASAVSAFFGADSTECDFASQYFSGVTNAQKSVSALWFGRRIEADAPAFVRSAEISATLADLKKIKAGALAITVNGTEKAVTGIDFSACASLSDVAVKLATAIGDVSGAYDSATKTITITTTKKGADASITGATSPASGTDISELLGLTEDAGAVVSQGADAQTATETMNAIINVSQNWVGFTTLYEVEADEAKLYASWADEDDQYVYIAWTTDKKCLNQLTSAGTLPVVLQDYNACACVFGDQQEASFILAVGASINWSANQGIKTWFAKTTSGLPARITSDAEADALDAIRCNYFGKFATRNAEFKIFNRGVMSGSLYGFIDVIYGNIWFTSKLQRSIMDGLVAVNRAPYNSRGYALVEAWMNDPILSAKKVGVIDSGVELSESQKAQIMQEVGEDISNDLYSKGYWYVVNDPEANVRADRGTPDISLYFTYAGSIQKIELPATEIL